MWGGNKSNANSNAGVDQAVNGMMGLSLADKNK